jgi:DNA replication protein DnaC
VPVRRSPYRALYVRTPRLLDDLALARGNGRLSRVMSSLARVDVLVLDDGFLRSLTSDQAADLLEVIEDRSNRSTIVTSQLPVNLWHEGLGDPTIASCWTDYFIRSVVFNINSESCRMRSHRARSEQLRKGLAGYSVE